MEVKLIIIAIINYFILFTKCTGNAGQYRHAMVSITRPIPPDTDQKTKPHFTKNMQNLIQIYILYIINKYISSFNISNVTKNTHKIMQRHYANLLNVKI